MTTRRMMIFVGLLGCGMVFAAGASSVAKNEGDAPAALNQMRVEEPSSPPPINNPSIESKAWKTEKNRSIGLTAEQKEASRERQEKMKEMISIIREKHKALHDAKPEAKAELARELQSLILDKDSGKEVSDNQDDQDKARFGDQKQKQIDRRVEQLEKKDEMLVKEEELKQEIEEKIQKLKVKGNGNGQGEQ